MKIIKTVEIEARVKAFTGETPRNYKLTVAGDGTVRVWDAVAGHYTTCHCMTPATEKRIRKLALAII